MFSRICNAAASWSVHLQCTKGAQMYVVNDGALQMHRPTASALQMPMNGLDMVLCKRFRFKCSAKLLDFHQFFLPLSLFKSGMRRSSKHHNNIKLTKNKTNEKIIYFIDAHAAVDRFGMGTKSHVQV
ncbi:MAG: hypothetical protein IJ527_03285 [Prevotella sp.]|nr:hypothetical protein [Prevotella sp.]